jgi:hypothetical protein
MRFICLELGADEHDLFRKDQGNADTIIENGVLFYKLAQTIAKDKTANFTFYGPAFCKQYSGSFSVSSNLMMVDAFAIAHGITITNNLSLTTQTFLWNINKYGEIRNSFWFTILTDSGLYFMKPKRQPTSKEIKGEIVSRVIDTNSSVNFEGESSGTFKISYDGDSVIPSVIDSTFKGFALNKAASMRDVVTILSGTDALPLDYYIDGGRIYVIISKKEIADHQWMYTAVLESDTSYSISAASETPLPILQLNNIPKGYLLNGKICVTVASNNITVAIKTLSGNDPSIYDTVFCRIGDTVRSITSTLSVTKNAGTNWFNSGSFELAMNEVDYFVYLGYNTTDGVTIGFARLPYANQYSNFSTTTTNEKYCAISTVTNAISGDCYENIGRFTATLSVGAGYTWSVPTFSPNNLIQRPIFFTRRLNWAPTWVGKTGGAYETTYKIVDSIVELHVYCTSPSTSNATNFTMTTPFSSPIAAYGNGAGTGLDSGSWINNLVMSIYINNIITLYKNSVGTTWTASGRKDVFFEAWMHII